MIELGRKSQISGAKTWRTFSMDQRPKRMPEFSEGHTIVCGLEEEGTEGERIFICETPEDVHALYDEHATSHAIHTSWYHSDALNNAVA